MSSSSATAPTNLPKPNYVNPESRKGGAIAYNTILIVAVVTVVSLRYYSRVGVLKQRLGWDDFFIGLSLLCTLALSIASIIANAEYGYSRHIWDIPPAWFPELLACGTVIKLAFILAATFTRISVLCFYSRLVHNSGVRWFRYALYASHIFVATLGVVFLLPMIFSCRPISAAFTVTKPKGAKCVNEGLLFYIGGIINTVADALITVLPIPLIMRLQMPRHEQIGVIVLLSLGFFVTLAGIVRTYYIWLAQVHTQDETWWSYPLFVAASVEVDVGIVCACIPTVRPIFAPYFKSLSTTFSSSKHSHNGTNPRGSLGGSRHSMHLGNNYSRNTPSPSKQAFLMTQQSLHSPTASRASTLHRATPDSTFSTRRENNKQEEFDLATLSQAQSRASISKSDTSAASTLVPSNALSPTGSIYIPRRAGNAIGKDRNNLFGSGISVIKEVQVEMGSSAGSDLAEPTGKYAALSRELSAGHVPTLPSPYPRANATQESQGAHREDSPFRPFTAPRSPPQAHDTFNSPTSILNDSNGDDWTRLPRIDRSSISSTHMNFSPYYPNLSHSQVAAAAGYGPDLEQGVARPEASSKNIGVAKTSSIEDLHDDEEDVESDTKYVSGGGRARDEEELVDVLQFFQESRIQKMEVVKGKARIVNNTASLK